MFCFPFCVFLSSLPRPSHHPTPIPIPPAEGQHCGDHPLPRALASTPVRPQGRDSSVTLQVFIEASSSCSWSLFIPNGKRCSLKTWICECVYVVTQRLFLYVLGNYMGWTLLNSPTQLPLQTSGNQNPHDSISSGSWCCGQLFVCQVSFVLASNAEITESLTNIN